MSQPFAVVVEIKEQGVLMRNIDFIDHSEERCWKYIEGMKKQSSLASIRFKVMSIAQARTLKRYSYNAL